VVSFLDDRIQLSPAPRFLVHVLASSIVVAGGIRFGGSLLQAAPAEVAVAMAIVLGLTWATNLFNFMDGLDGFAGGMAVVGFAALAWIAWRAGAPALAGVTGVLAAAAAGFLVFNRPVAEIFMGDAGASTLGFLAGSIAVLGVRDGVWPWQAAALIFSPFFVDASVTLARRAARGEKVWLPHRTHYYQRLVGAGWSHRRTVLWEYVLMLACAATAILGMERGWDSWAPALVSWTVVYGACMWFVNVVERRQGRSARQAQGT
jgi:UDP-N-acetylmuramyl pentapeptide phosphotransferase/UDP-N-acetylglucosamine-1-phosphate transferase